MSRRKSSSAKAVDKSSVVGKLIEYCSPVYVRVDTVSFDFHYRIIAVQDSPVSSMKRKGNLTGNARVMRDHVVEMSTLIQRWNAELLEGTTAVDEINSIMFKRMYVLEQLILAYRSHWFT